MFGDLFSSPATYHSQSGTEDARIKDGADVYSAQVASRESADTVASVGSEGRASRAVKLTVSHYMNLPDSEEKRYELVDGELHMVPSPTPEHQDIAMNLALLLAGFVRANKLGKVSCAPLDVVLSEEDVFQPDLLYISNARLGIRTQKNIQGAPDLVVEILSPGTRDRDRNIKRSRYARFGVREYWLVDPDARSIEVLKATESGFDTVGVYPESTVAVSPLLEGLRIEVADIFG